MAASIHATNRSSGGCRRSTPLTSAANRGCSALASGSIMLFPTPYRQLGRASSAIAGLFEIGREPGKGGEIVRVVLHDEPCLPVLDDPLDAVDRGERFRSEERRVGK